MCQKYQVVGPSCETGACGLKHNKGWVIARQTKTGIKKEKTSQKKLWGTKKRRAKDMAIDLTTYTTTRIEDSFENWLAETKPAWDQLTFDIIQTRRQIKKQRS